MKLSQTLTTVATSILTLGLCGCASIVSHSTWPVTFDTNPQGAEVTISNAKGEALQRGQSPYTITLKSGRGFFVPAHYYIEAKMNGCTTVKQRVNAHFNGWYVGNLVFGSVIGLLIVDPATGAMYRMPER